jgi:hypothetical protein
MRPESSSVEEHKAYLLQVLYLGMLLAAPEELDGLDEQTFGDPVLRDVVSELKERRKRRGKNGPTLLKTLLVEWGCEEGIGSVEDAKSAIRDRVESMGLFLRAVRELDKLVKVTVENRNLSNTELRRFAAAVKGAE